MSTILIVEDNEKNLKLVRDVLQFKGYTTREARTAAEGLRLARELPALILLDIQLPDFDGVTVLARLRADPVTQAIPVIAVSASAMPDDQKRILASGFDDYIMKPIELRRLLETVGRFVAGP